jgi:hypothetical protein
VGTSTTAVYLCPGYVNAAAGTTKVTARLPRAGTLRNLRINQIAGTGGQTETITVQINGSNTAVVAAAANTSTNFADTTHSVAGAAGDTIDLAVTKSGTFTTSPTAVTAWLELA